MEAIPLKVFIVPFIMLASAVAESGISTCIMPGFLELSYYQPRLTLVAQKCIAPCSERGLHNPS
jgi:hypothetical protein